MLELIEKISSIESKEIHPWFEVNVEGYPICLNEHMIEAARGKNTYVLLMDDYQDGESITISNLAPDSDLNDTIKKDFDGRVGRCRVNFL